MDPEDLLHYLLCVQICGSGLYLMYNFSKSYNWLNRRWWTRPINLRREEMGFYTTLYQELQDDPDMHFRLFRIDDDQLQRLLNMLNEKLLRKSRRKPICPNERLIVTLRYLASGDSTSTIASHFRMGQSTVRKIIKETCNAICEVMLLTVLAIPCEREWKEIMLGYLQNFNFPNCCGACDGKLISIKAPPNSGSLYYNYKQYFSINLIAVCDSNCKFTLVDVGSYGSDSDAGIFANSWFGQAIEEKRLNLPTGRSLLPGSNISMPCFFIGDEAFGLSSSMMRPYSGHNLPEDQKIFNYRLSRARSTIERAFGILTTRWQVLLGSIDFEPETVDKIVLAVICLHNWIMIDNLNNEENDNIYCPPDFIPETNEQMNRNCRRGERSRRAQTELAYDLRNQLKDYFLSESGQVPWQYDYVRRGFNRDC